MPKTLDEMFIEYKRKVYQLDKLEPEEKEVQIKMAFVAGLISITGEYVKVSKDCDYAKFSDYMTTLMNDCNDFAGSCRIKNNNRN